MLKNLTHSAPLIVLALTPLLSGPAAAQAASDHSQNRLDVPYADLDLAGKSGQARLMTRVTEAAAELCGLDSRWVAEHQKVTACRSAAMQSAMPQVAEAVRKAELKGSVTIVGRDKDTQSEAYAMNITLAR